MNPTAVFAVAWVVTTFALYVVLVGGHQQRDGLRKRLARAELKAQAAVEASIPGSDSPIHDAVVVDMFRRQLDEGRQS